MLTVLFTVNPPLSQRTHVPTAQLDMPSSISLHQVRLSVPSLSSPERRSLSARSLFNLPASLSQTPRRVRVLPAVVRGLREVRAAVDNLVVDVAEAVDEEAAVDVTVVQ